MDKYNVAKHLVGLKYDAEVVDGIVVIWVKEAMQKKQKERVRNELRAVGYRGSWGWRMKGAEA